MSYIDPVDLRHLCEAWRSKNADIEERYGKQAPNLVNHVVAGIEACAQDVENLIRESELRHDPGAKSKPQ